MFCKKERKAAAKSKRQLAALFLGFTLISLSACGNSDSRQDEAEITDDSKDFENMLKQAQMSDDSGSKKGSSSSSGESYIQSLVSKDHYKSEFSDEQQGYHVNINADVDIPEADKMQIIRLTKREIDQELTDKIRDGLAGDTRLYDYILSDIEDQKDIEESIEYYKDELQYFEDNASDYTEEQLEEEKRFYNEKIKELENALEAAPEKIDYREYLYDTALQVVSELYNAYPDNRYISWQYSLNPEGTITRAISDYEESDGYTYFCVQNSSRYGNTLKFERSKHVLDITYGGITGSLDSTVFYPFDEGIGFITSQIEQDKRGFSFNEAVKESSLHLYEDEPCELSGDAARKLADSFLEKVGLSDYSLDYGELDYQLFLNGKRIDGERSNYNHDSYNVRKVWVLNYLRKIDNVPVRNYGEKYSEGYEGSDFIKHVWAEEYIQILVNDSGIVGFILSTPLQMENTVVEDSNMKSFDKILNTFEESVKEAYANPEDDDFMVDTWRLSDRIDINKIELTYTRVSEDGDFNSGLLVPAWTFIGDLYSDSELLGEDYPVMTINAIDGTVINYEEGY